MHRGLLFTVTALALIALAAPAQAQQPTQAQANAIRQACRADYQAHCSGVPTGGSAALACLQQNASSVSPGCQSALAAVNQGATAAPPATAPATVPPPTTPPRAPLSPRQEMALMRQACGPDYRAYCSGIRPGGGRAIACLQAHGPDLSRPCQSALMAARQGR